jgi:hypothetical protein
VRLLDNIKKSIYNAGIENIKSIKINLATTVLHASTYSGPSSEGTPLEITKVTKQ